jgi:hypothetical protein
MNNINHLNQMDKIRFKKAYERGMGNQEKLLRRKEKARLNAKKQRIEEKKAEGKFKLSRIERDNIWLQEQREYVL